VASFALAGAAVTSAAPPADATGAKTELDELRQRIDGLKKEIAAAEESRTDIADQLRETEQAISAAGRRLRELAAEGARAEDELRQLDNQSAALEKRVAVQQEQLGRLLTRHYLAGEADQLRLILGGSDPNQVARDVHYLKHLSRAQAELIGQLRSLLGELSRLASRAKEKREELARIEVARQQEQQMLIARQSRRKQVLAGIADRIRLQRREIETLRRDEKRLTRLIEGLSRIIARPARRETSPRAPATESGRKPAPILKDEGAPESTSTEQMFAMLKGRLRLPVRGELVTRFGAPRSEGGGSSKGWFIRADGGNEVMAVAAGRVVFADWLRGFGNLIILDHGGGYLSVYGNNEALLKTVGQAVNAGQAIAAVGASGGNTESGLYFELRREGQPIDPMKWLSSKRNGK